MKMGELEALMRRENMTITDMVNELNCSRTTFYRWREHGVPYWVEKYLMYRQSHKDLQKIKGIIGLLDI